MSNYLTVPKTFADRKITNFNVKALVDETIREGVERSAFAINVDSKYELVKRMHEAGLREFVLGISPENTELLSKCLESKVLGDFTNDTKFIFIALLNSWETTFHYPSCLPRILPERPLL
jgi:2-isopropylmalate synthase